MKKSIVYTLCGLCFLLNCLKAQTSQEIICLQHLGSPKFYTDLNTAITASVSNDTIYISPGTFNAGNVTISKKLSIYGVGHYPDTIAGRTYINGYFTLLTGADNIMITGIYLTGDIIFGTSRDNQNVKNIYIKRCSFNSMYQCDAYYSSGNTILEEVVIRGASISGSDNYSTFSVNCIKSFICGKIYDLASSSFSNCIFFFTSSNTTDKLFNDATASVNNCIIFKKGTLASNNSINYNNNIFNDNFTNLTTTNLVNVDFATLFIKGKETFDYNADYRLTAGSPGKNAGSDGYDIGVYGTSVPYKTKAIPDNPYISKKSIIAGKDNSGNPVLKVNITVEAQDR